MKYMGSKRSMLLNGLGEAIEQAVPGHTRFVDLFAGSGSVAWHVARNYPVPVLAADLQQFSVALAEGVLLRTEMESPSVAESWISDAQERVDREDRAGEAKRIQSLIGGEPIEIVAKLARALCADSAGVIQRAYGGYYYSPLQALWLDSLRAALPADASAKAICKASLIWAASSCAASPGHTAQPFKPNETAGRYLAESWQKSVPMFVNSAFGRINCVTAMSIGSAVQQDANSLAAELREGDLAFLDPPYSSVHYSRFYHVLETLVHNEHVEVSGSGRYPPADMRPKSRYSVLTSSMQALEEVLAALSQVGVNAIVTFPAGAASNGLSGDHVREISERYYRIKSAKVSGRFSTLGGNSRNRNARAASEELILFLQS